MAASRPLIMNFTFVKSKLPLDIAIIVHTTVPIENELKNVVIPWVGPNDL